MAAVGTSQRGDAEVEAALMRRATKSAFLPETTKPRASHSRFSSATFMPFSVWICTNHVVSVRYPRNMGTRFKNKHKHSVNDNG